MKRSYKFANSLVKAYGKQSIFYKYWKKILLYTLIPFALLCLTVYAVVSLNTEQKLFASATSEFEKSLLLLNNELSVSYDNHISMSADEYITLFFLSPSPSSDFYLNFNVRDNIVYTLQSRVASSDIIKNIDLYSYANNCVFQSERNGHIPYSGNTWVDAFNECNKQILLLPENDTSFRIIFPAVRNNTTDGLISFCLESDKLIKNINSFSSEASICLYDKNTGTTILGNNELVKSFNPSEEISKAKNGSEYFFSAETLFDDIYLLAKCKKSAGETGIPILLIIFACVIISLLLSVALSFYMSMQLYNSIAVITAEIQKNFEENGVTGGTVDELKYISTKLMELENKNKATEKELVNKISSLRLYQTIMLQNQFNPHFIFNTLNSVTMILANQKLTDERPIEMISLLCNLMRGAINTERYIISLENELKYSQTYIQLEKIKQKDNFDVEYDIDTALLSQNTIKFILQPILENAFEHGIKKLPAGERGKISLTICRQKENIMISISDNGPGMSQFTLAKLLKQLREEDLLSSSHIGLCNTNNRIRIFYGEDYGITNIKSDETGTTIQISIPYDPNGKIK